MKLFLVILMVIPCILSELIHLNEITPEEAQKFFTEQSLDLNYAKKLNEVPLPLLRSETGRDYYVNGRVIDNPEDYIEETYQAAQFHGQDGLGRAMFGYTDVNQARLEARNANGDVRGSYQYVDPNGENIIVQYWSDSLGFHQSDNIPKIVLEPVTETAEVQAARLEHERAWKEAARMAKVNPDPNSDFYNRRAIEYDTQVEGEASEAASVSVSNKPQTLNRYPQGRSDESVAASEIESKSVARSTGETDEEVEIPSVPRGFFYKFDYPVQVIAETPAKRALNLKQAEHEGAPKVRRHDEVAATPVETVAVVNAEVSQPEVKTIEGKPETNEAIALPAKTLAAEADVKPEFARVSLKATEEGGIPVDAVHDAQVHPKQKSDLVNSQVLPVVVHDD
jgi:hypothetical protein